MCLFNRYPELQLGDSGKDVFRAVTYLQQHGSSISNTLIFHIGVRSAVISFQKKHGLLATGVIDKKTWKQLKKRHRVS